MRSKKLKRKLTLKDVHEYCPFELQVPWPLDIGYPGDPERFCWPFPGQQMAWKDGDVIWGVLFIGDEVRGFTVSSRYYNDAVPFAEAGSAFDAEDVYHLPCTNRVVRNVGDPECVQRVFNDVVRLIAKQRNRAERRSTKRRIGRMLWNMSRGIRS